MSDHLCIGDGGGPGLMVRAEMVKDCGTREILPQLRDRMAAEVRHRGLPFVGDGANTVGSVSPLNVSPAHVCEAPALFESVVTPVQAG